MAIEDRLRELGVELPPSAGAGGLYVPAVAHGDIAYVSGQLPREGDTVFVIGKVGSEVTLASARCGARIALIRALAALRDALGTLDRVRRVLKLTVFVQSAADFSDQSAVADGASELICQIFGSENGRHARTAVGVAQLPRNASVEVEIVVALAA